MHIVSKSEQFFPIIIVYISDLSVSKKTESVGQDFDPNPIRSVGQFLLTILIAHYYVCRSFFLKLSHLASETEA